MWSGKRRPCRLITICSKPREQSASVSATERPGQQLGLGCSGREAKPSTSVGGRPHKIQILQCSPRIEQDDGFIGGNRAVIDEATNCRERGAAFGCGADALVTADRHHVT